MGKVTEKISALSGSLKGQRKLVMAISGIIGIIATMLVGDLEAATAAKDIVYIVLGFMGANVGEHLGKK